MLSLSKHFSSDWSFSADCRSAKSLMIAAAAQAREGAGTENYFTVPDEIVEPDLWSNKICWGQWAEGQATSLPWPRPGSLPPFHFPGRGGHNAVVLCVQSLDTGTDRSQVLSPGWGHTNTLWCRGLDLRFTNSERALTWVSKVMSSARSKINFSPSIKRKKWSLKLLMIKNLRIALKFATKPSKLDRLFKELFEA